MVNIYHKFNNVYRKNRKVFTAGIFIAYTLFCAILFLHFPVTYAPDSDGYIGNAILLFEKSSMSGYFAYRGLGVPLILSLGFKAAGVTHTGIRVALMGLFIIYAISLFVIAYNSGFFADLISLLKFAVMCVCLIINPVITTYSHMCLTEFPVIAAVAVFFACMTVFRKKNIVYPIRFIICGIACVLCYSIKQVSFPLPLIVFSAAEMWNLITDKKYKSVINIVLCAVISLAMTFGYVKWWGNFLAQSGGSSVEGDSVSSFAGSFIVDGLRYFNPSDVLNFEDEIDIYVMDDLFETKLATIHTKMGTSLEENIKYWLTCFKTSPERVFKGYKDNYAVICGVHNTIVVTTSRMHTRVTITKMFFNGQENEAWVSYMCTGTPDEFIERINTPALERIEEFDSEKYLSSFLTKLVYMNANNRFGFFQYSFISYYAWITALASMIAVIVLKKKGLKNNNLYSIFICALSTFVYIAFLAVVAQNIDRYGITTYILCGLIMINLISCVIDTVNSMLKNKI